MVVTIQKAALNASKYVPLKYLF